jgi:curved DNA-binding protein CbpA
MLTIDRRTFRRHKSHSECEIRLASGTYKGRLLDYSDGVGAIIEKGPELEPGTGVEIWLFDFNIAFQAEIVWVKKSGDCLHAGFRRNAALRGFLNNFRLADILNYLQRDSKTGVLVIRSGTIVKKVYINHGDILFAVSNEVKDHFGEFLIREKRITREELEKARELQERTGPRLGKMLVELGYLEPKDILESVKLQVEEIILSLFGLEDGEFEFLEGPLPTELITLRVSTSDIIFRGMKRIQNQEYIRSACPATDAVLNFSPCALKTFQHFSVDDTDKQILAYVSGRNSINTIVALSPYSEFETLRVLYAFYSVGFLEVKTEDEPCVEHYVEEVLRGPDTVLSKKFIDEIEDMYEKYESRGYYGILGIKKRASLDEIKKAACGVLKKYHPDIRYALPHHDIAIKKKLHSIFSYIVKAYQTLHDHEKRREYDRVLSEKAASRTKRIAAGLAAAIVIGSALFIILGDIRKEKLHRADSKNNMAMISGKGKEQIADDKKISATGSAVHHSLEISPKAAFSSTQFYVVTTSFNFSDASIQWFVDESPVPDARGPQFKPKIARKGNTIYAKAFIGGEEVMSNAVQIKNSPPEISKIDLLPEAFKPGNKLLVDTSVRDRDGDNVTLSYEWTKNGERAGNSREVAFPLKRGDTFSVRVIPFDGEDYGQPVILKREILNLPPEIIEDLTYKFDGMMYTYQVKASDPDGDPLVYSLTDGPDGMIINSTTGLVRWNIPREFVGETSYSVSVSDDYGGETTQDVSININP